MAEAAVKLKDEDKPRDTDAIDTSDIKKFTSLQFTQRVPFRLIGAADAVTVNKMPHTAEKKVEAIVKATGGFNVFFRAPPRAGSPLSPVIHKKFVPFSNIVSADGE